MLLAVACFSLLITAVLGQGTTISGISTSGTGCPAGSTLISINQARDGFTVTFDQFAFFGQDASRTRTCRLVLQLSTPMNWRSTELDLDIRGFIGLDTGAVAELKQNSVTVAVPRPGRAPPRTTVQSPVVLQTFTGPSRQIYFIQASVSGLNSVGQSTKCEAGVATVTYELVASVQAGQNQLVLDSIDGKLTNDVLWQTGRRRRTTCGK
jgi:hypothetical protein